MKIYCFDLDETLCNTFEKDYKKSTPITEMIDRVNYLYEQGNIIKIFTARGMGKFSGSVDKVNDVYYELTKSQLEKWGIKYHELYLGKQSFDYFIDDKNLTIDQFKSMVKPKVGFIAGSFDVIHPGYIEMFEFIKERCDYFILGLHKDPSVERPTKLKPILSVEERKKILMSIKYIDEIVVYETESELIEILSSGIADVRFLGDDYKDKDFNGSHLPLEIIYVNREHNWSTTKFKNLISEDINKNIKKL
jgi:glycerol-3-phosphate cytidylyltransferase